MSRKTTTARNKWSAQVKSNAGNRCQYCGATDKLAAHHIKPLRLFPELDLVVENGVCLCRRHHLAAHGGVFNPGSVPSLQHVTEREIKEVAVFLDSLLQRDNEGNQ